MRAAFECTPLDAQPQDLRILKTCLLGAVALAIGRNGQLCLCLCTAELHCLQDEYEDTGAALR